ncbi:unnamed protein product [Prorocentrum cordatum]|uniref:Uncharacterized protein n=1 Tax=Prorocentrum cordatum TaxID=2364126 RepID=A0ABN9Q7Q6_9DINO|nr:unnamed protein product [Polarella glacialis]
MVAAGLGLTGMRSESASRRLRRPRLHDARAASRVPPAAHSPEVLSIAELNVIEVDIDACWLSPATLTHAACEDHNGCEQHESDSEECELDGEQHETRTEELEQGCGPTVKTLRGHDGFEQSWGQTMKTPTCTLQGDVGNEREYAGRRR